MDATESARYPAGLVEFLLARLDEEQRPTFELVPYECEPGCCAPAGWVGHRCLPCGTATEYGGTIEAITDIAREHEESIHRRAYVLADIAAKRRIIDLHGDQHDCIGGLENAIRWPYVGCDVLFFLAAPFSFHPDWQSGWSIENER